MLCSTSPRFQIKQFVPNIFPMKDTAQKLGAPLAYYLN